jgi:glycine/D-amino acid oxidase-like deaminating enzyme
MTSAKLSSHHEVVVVGAGITGLSTALLLAEAGVDVAVVEARRPGGGTTARSTAKASLLHGTRTGQIRNRHGVDVARDYQSANVAGQELIHRVIDQTGFVDHSVHDAWTYATSQKGIESVQAEARALQEIGQAAELAVPDELPFDVTEAVRLPDQLQVDPAQYVAALCGALNELGVPIVWPQRIASVTPRQGALHLTCTQGATVSANWVVLATLLPFPLRTLTFATTKPTRSHTLACRVDGSLPQGMYLSADSPTHSLRTATSPTGEEFLLVGGHDHPTGRENPTSQHVQGLAQWAQENFPVTEFTHRWGAQDFASSDLLPHVGPAPVGPSNLLIASGFGKWGFTNGSAAAIALAGIITKNPPQWAAMLRPRLTHGLRGLQTLAVNNAEVGLNLAKGWLIEPGHRTGSDARVARDFPHPQAVSTVDGQRRVCSAVCTHLGGIVRWNDAEKSWDCPLHGSRFAPDGEVLTGPAVHGLAVQRS